MTLGFDLELNNDEFVFQTDVPNADISFEIESCKLALPQIKLNDKEFAMIEENLEKNSLKTYFETVEINNHPISGESKIETFQTIGLGVAPSRVFLIFQETSR